MNHQKKSISQHICLLRFFIPLTWKTCWHKLFFNIGIIPHRFKMLTFLFTCHKDFIWRYSKNIMGETGTPSQMRFYIMRVRYVTSGIVLVLLGMILTLSGCEDTNLQLATEAGIDAVRAVTLSDEDVRELALRAAKHADDNHKIAGNNSKYTQRLHRLVGDHAEHDGIEFNYKVYLAPQVNAFAMADGTIRVYSGLMELMDDGELRFVIGHEMGHVVQKHTRNKVMLAYAGSAIRKGIASQENIAGDLARSALGSLAERLVNAQFSQQEEREADDFGLKFMQQQGYDVEKAISALEKLASLGKNHSFLSSHPAPEDRPKRLMEKIQHAEEEVEESLLVSIFNKAKNLVLRLVDWIFSFFQ